jgi:secretion/DNA translocation related TadE-like protein
VTPAGSQQRDEGAGTVLALGLVALLASLVLACVALGAVVVARHRAASAADLAALAGADRTLGRAAGAPCSAARTVARVNGGVLSKCSVTADGTVSVVVQVRLPPPWDRLGTAQARARAGRAPPNAQTAEAPG